MKKQPRGVERRKTRKGAPVRDLAPGSGKQSGVKAGAFDSFATGGDTARVGHEKWIELQSVSWGIGR